MVSSDGVTSSTARAALTGPGDSRGKSVPRRNWGSSRNQTSNSLRKSLVCGSFSRGWQIFLSSLALAGVSVCHEQAELAFPWKRVLSGRQLNAWPP